MSKKPMNSPVRDWVVNEFNRLKAEKRITQAKLGQALGITQPQAQRLLSGERGISADEISLLEKLFGAPYTGKGNAVSPIVNHTDSVNVVGTVSAGVFSEGTNLILEDISVPAVPRKDVPGAAQYAMRVSGNSVNKKIPDQSYAICAPIDRMPGGAQHGQLVHVVRERSGLQEHTIKEVRFTAEGVELWAVSTDPSYNGPILVDGDDSTTAEIRGIVIGAFTPL